MNLARVMTSILISKCVDHAKNKLKLTTHRSTKNKRVKVNKNHNQFIKINEKRALLSNKKYTAKFLKEFFYTVNYKIGGGGG